jgi:hypothetical protein
LAVDFQPVLNCIKFLRMNEHMMLHRPGLEARLPWKSTAVFGPSFSTTMDNRRATPTPRAAWGISSRTDSSKADRPRRRSSGYGPPHMHHSRHRGTLGPRRRDDADRPTPTRACHASPESSGRTEASPRCARCGNEVAAQTHLSVPTTRSTRRRGSAFMLAPYASAARSAHVIAAPSTGAVASRFQRRSICRRTAARTTYGIRSRGTAASTASRSTRKESQPPQGTPAARPL